MKTSKKFMLAAIFSFAVAGAWIAGGHSAAAQAGGTKGTTTAPLRPQVTKRLRRRRIIRDRAPRVTPMPTHQRPAQGDIQSIPRPGNKTLASSRAVRVVPNRANSVTQLFAFLLKFAP